MKINLFRLIFAISLPFLLSFSIMGGERPDGSEGSEKTYCELKGTVFLEEVPSLADYRVFREEVESFADLLVFKENVAEDADSPGIWHFTDVKAFADFSIAWTQVKSFADFSVTFTKFKSAAGCGN